MNELNTILLKEISNQNIIMIEQQKTISELLLEIAQMLSPKEQELNLNNEPTLKELMMEALVRLTNIENSLHNK